MKSSHKLKNQKSEHIQAIEQPLISLDLKFFIKQMKLRYLKSFLQSRSSLLPSYCNKIFVCIPGNNDSEHDHRRISRLLDSFFRLYFLLLIHKSGAVFGEEWHERRSKRSGRRDDRDYDQRRHFRSRSSAW